MTYKYEPLNCYLLNSTADMVTLRFDEINKIIGSDLPPCLSGKDYTKRLLWNNNVRNYATRSWLEAGYVFVEYSKANSCVTFRRALIEAKRHLDEK